MNIKRLTIPVTATLLFAVAAHAQTQETEGATRSDEQRRACLLYTSDAADD